MGFWKKLLADILNERNEHEIDRIWAKNLGMKEKDAQLFYDLMRGSRDAERCKSDRSKKD